MSKIGQNPISFSQTVTVNVEDHKVVVKGALGEMTVQFPTVIKVVKEADKLLVTRTNDEKKAKSLHGLYRQLISNAIVGVEKPWQKRLEVVGTGFNVKMQGADIVLKVGYSHQVVFKKVAGLKFAVEENNKIVVSGIDKQLVGQVAHQIKMVRKPDVYKGKGIRYENEVIKLKPGKKVKTATGAGAA